MQQRVAIARALASQPRILLMDEPFASVDAQTRADLEDLTLSVRDRFGITVVMVTHDIDESVYLSDRVLVLHGAPAGIAHDIPVQLPQPRSQIATRSHPEFVGLRTASPPASRTADPGQGSCLLRHRRPAWPPDLPARPIGGRHEVLDLPERSDTRPDKGPEVIEAVTAQAKLADENGIRRCLPHRAPLHRLQHLRQPVHVRRRPRAAAAEHAHRSVSCGARALEPAQLRGVMQPRSTCSPAAGA